jgi:gamma-glutamyltranspeptidase / glutathione hydrolase
LPIGYVAADEPIAVKVGRDILVGGGTAADAAVAMSLAMSVTLPSRAGLGGGGACLLRTGSGVWGLDFLPRASASSGEIGLPMLAGGLRALHGAYGRLRWEQLVAPAESLARLGTPVSKALLRDIADSGAPVQGPFGRPLAEGDVMRRDALASSLAALRVQGGGSIVSGDLAQAVLAGSQGRIAASDLKEATPVWRKPMQVEFADGQAWVSPSPGGALAEKLLQETKGGNTGGTAASTAKVIFVAETAAKLATATPVSSSDDRAAGLVAVDREGGAVACSLTMGGFFGTGLRLGETGFPASRPVPSASAPGLSVASLLVAKEGRLIAVMASGGDAQAPQVLVQVLLRAVADGEPLERAMSAPRMVASGEGRFAVETGLELAPEQKNSHPTVEAPFLGSVDAVLCPAGLPADIPNCTTRADPRSFGLAGVAMGH